MKRIFVVIVVISIVVITCQNPVSRTKTYSVKIKFGVVMKSGDVKNVARRDVIITKADMIALWETSKINNHWDRSLIEKEVKEELGYEAQLASFQESINQAKQTAIASRAEPPKKLRSHVEETYQKGKAYPISLNFDKFRYEPVDLGAYLVKLDTQYNEVISSNIDPSAKQYFAQRYAEFKRIRNLFQEAGAVGIKSAADVESLGKQQKEFIEDVNKKVSARYQEYFEKAKNEFLNIFKEAYLLSVKTDLNGEARVTLPGGRSFLFCDAEVGLSHITWNCPVEIFKEDQYIELSNDNAASLEENEVAQLLMILAGLETLPNKDK